MYIILVGFNFCANFMSFKSQKQALKAVKLVKEIDVTHHRLVWLEG